MVICLLRWYDLSGFLAIWKRSFVLIQQIREFTKGWVAFVIFTAVALTFVLWGVGSYLGSHGHHQGDAAKVYGDKVSLAEVNNMVEFYKSSPVGIEFQRMSAPFKDQQQEKDLISAFNSWQQTQTSGSVGQAEKSFMSKNPQWSIDPAQESQWFNPPAEVVALYRQDAKWRSGGGWSVALDSADGKKVVVSYKLVRPIYRNLTERQALDDLIAQKIWAHTFPSISLDGLRVMSKVSSFTLPQDAMFFSHWLSDHSHFQYVRIPVTSFVASQQEPTDKEKKAYYQAHQGDFRVPAQQQFEYVLIDYGKTILPSIKVTPAEIKAFYDANRSRYQEAKKVDLTVLTADFSNNKEQQSKLAAFSSWRQSGGSADTFIKNNSGWSLTQESKSSPDKAVIRLSRLRQGQWSDARVEGGKLIAYKLDKIAWGNIEPQTQIDAKIKAELVEQKARLVKSSLLAQLRQAITIEPGELPTTVMLGSGSTSVKVTLKPVVSSFMVKGRYDSYFSDPAVGDVMQSNADQISAGDVAPPVVLSDGNVLIFDQKKLTPARLQAYEEVKSEVSSRLRLQKAKSALTQFVAKIKQQLAANSTADVEKELQAKSVNWKTFKMDPGMDDYMKFLFGMDQLGLASSKPAWPKTVSADLEKVLDHVALETAGESVIDFEIPNSNDVMVVQRFAPEASAGAVSQVEKNEGGDFMSRLLYDSELYALSQDNISRAEEGGHVKRYANFN